MDLSGKIIMNHPSELRCVLGSLLMAKLKWPHASFGQQDINPQTYMEYVTMYQHTHIYIYTIIYPKNDPNMGSTPCIEHMGILFQLSLCNYPSSLMISGVLWLQYPFMVSLP